MPLLSIEKLSAGYGPIQVLHEVSLDVGEGEIVALIGANGAGKSTTLRAISQLIPIRSGTIRYRGRAVAGGAHAVARMGISHVPEGRGIFGNLTVRENLLLGSFAARHRPVHRKLDPVFEIFPILGQRQNQLSSTLSGGEQQMLAIGRALVADGDLLILDEPSMGLSPLLVGNVFSVLSGINRKGKAVLLVEQNASMALKISRRAYVLENGRIAAQGESAVLASNEDVKRAYLG